MTVNALQSFLERGPERRAALENALAYYIPPELRGWLGLANELNPVVSMERAGGAAEMVADPNVQGWDKVAAFGDMTSNMANALAPVVLGSSGAVPATNAVEEALMGFSAASPMAYAARDFVADEFGGVKVWTGGSGDPIKAASDRGAWFAETPDLAKEYAGQGGRVLSAEIDPRNPIAFRHAEQRRPIGDVISTALEGAGQGANFEAARPIVERLYQRYGAEPRALFEYWNNDKDVADLFRALGYDAISAAEKSDMKAATWAALDPSIVRMEAADPIASRGAQIMDMLRSGRGADVTDEMLDMGDPTLNARLNEWLFNNYDLPMDAASRAARAKDAGFRGPTYHATSADIAAINPSRMDTGMSYGTGEGAFWTTTQPKTADTYLPGAYVKEGSGGAAMGDGVERYYTEGSNVIPTMNRLRNADVWDMGGGGYPTGGVSKYIADARRDGSDVVLFQRMKDQGIMGLGSGSADNTSIAAINPTTVRSRFARFDPRLSHLRNLSAGIGGAVLMSDMFQQEEDEPRNALSGFLAERGL